MTDSTNTKEILKINSKVISKLNKEIDEKNTLISKLQENKEVKSQVQVSSSPKKEQVVKANPMNNEPIIKQTSYKQEVKDDSQINDEEQEEHEEHGEHDEYVDDYEEDDKDQVEQQDPNIIEDDEHDEEENREKEFKGELKAIISDIEVDPLFDKLKLWFQRNNIKYNNMGQVLPSEITIMKLEHKLKSIGFKDAEERLSIWRYIIEPRNEKMIEFNENKSISKEKAENILKSKIEDYKIYEFDDVLQKRINEKIGRFKETVKDALEWEDLDGTGYIAASSLKGWFHAMDISLDTDLIDYLIYISGVTDKVGNSKSLMIEYNKILELLDKSGNAKKGESQLPDKGSQKEDKHDYSDDYGNDFEDTAKNDKPKETTSEPKETDENNQEYRAEGEGDELDQEIDDEEMISIAENWLIRIAEELLNKKVTIRQLYKEDIIDEEIEGEKIELLLPLSFLEGLKRLEINDFSQLEIAWLMNVLAKPQLENTILLDELIDIMENLGIQDEGAEPSTTKK